MAATTAPAPRFIKIVALLFIAASIIGLVVSVAQAVLIFDPARGLGAGGRARVLALGLVASSAFVLVVSVALLHRRPWARRAFMVIVALGFLLSVAKLLTLAPAIEAPPPEAPPEYLRLLRIILIANVAAPIAGCLAFGWIFARLRSHAVRDEFR